MASSNPSRSGGSINDRIEVIAAAGPKKVAEDGTLLAVPITEVGPHPDQPRTVINKEKQKELKVSLIRTRGAMTPIEVRRALPDELKAEPQFPYRLIAGQRRLEAYRELHDEAQSPEAKSEWATIRAILKMGVDEADALERALIENIQRDELLPLDEAEAYARIKKKRGLKGAREVAAAVGKKEERVRDLLRINEAPDVIKDALRNGLKVVRMEDGEDGATREKRETLRRLEVSEALRFMQLYDYYFEKGGAFVNRSAAAKAIEATRKVMERALADGWGTRRVEEYVRGVKSGRPEASEPKLRQLFKLDDKQLVVYRQRLAEASPEEKAQLKEALGELQLALA